MADGLDELVERSLEDAMVDGYAGGDEQHSIVQTAVDEATGRTDPETKKRPKNDVSDRQVVVLGSGNLGLVYLMEVRHRMTLEEIEERHPRLISALREHPHIGWLLVRSGVHGAVVLGRSGACYLDEARVEGDDPLAPFSATAHLHLRRTDGFAHVADIMIGSFYDPIVDEGCALEELISFHGGLGGPQTRPFVLAPPRLVLPDEPIIGAASVHALLSGWRGHCRLRPPRGPRVDPTWRPRDRDMRVDPRYERTPLPRAATPTLGRRSRRASSGWGEAPDRAARCTR